MSMYRNPPLTQAGMAKMKRSKRAREAFGRAAAAEGAALSAHALRQKRSAAAKKAAATRAKKYGKRKASPQQIRALKREGAYRRAIKRGLPPEKAAARAMREVPYTKSKRGTTYKGVKVYTGKASKSTAKRRKKPGPMPRQYKTTKATRKVKRTVATKVKRKVRVAYRRYKRVSLQDPRTGKKRLSYMARGKKGRLKKIPAWAIAGARSAKEFRSSDKFAKARERITKRRAAAARRMEKSGGPFTPNRSKKTMRKPKGKKRSRSEAAKLGHRRRKAKKVARRTKRPVGKGRGRLGVKLKRGKIYYKGRKPRALKGRKKGVRRLPKARILLTNRKTRRYSANKSRKSTKRSRAAKKAWRTRKARAAARRSPRRTKRRSGKRRSYAPNRKGKRSSGRRAMSKRRSRRGRRYTANQFMGQLKKLGVTALFAVTGFLAHKVLTRLLVEKVVAPALTPKATAGVGAWQDVMLKWSPIIVGGVVAGVGVAAMHYAAPKRRDEVGAGMIVSFLHTSILTVLGNMEDPKVKEAAKWIAGYDTSSTAASIGRYRRTMQGLGDAPQRSTLPHYAPTGRRGVLQQAVAGRGTGEYFQASGLGEYFASGVQGIGAYELAGPLVTQAAAGLGQRIDDGIRPDANLDAVLTLAEAMAGGGGVGEYYSADPSGAPYTVPQDDQWVPNNPLWAGTKGADDSPETSEIPAGILETAGGNGIFG